MVAAGGSVSRVPEASVGYVQCPTGQYQVDTDLDCSTCLAGTYTPTEGLFACVDCEAGRYNTAAEQADCDDCTNGQYQELLGQTDCDSCDPGSYTSDGTQKFECALCEPGKAQAAGGQASCDLCDAGEQQPLPGQTICEDCVPGKYASVQGTAECFECDLGQTGADSGMSMCDDCAPGKYKDVLGAEECTDCPKGTYTDEVTILSSCVPCAAGSYQSLEGQGSCINCPAGYYLNYTNAESLDECEACEAGTVNTESGSVTCGECQSTMTFQDEAGQDECLSCGHQSVAAGNHTVCECDFSYYAIPFDEDTKDFERLDPEAFALWSETYTSGVFDPNEHLGFWCVACPEGANCLQTGTVAAEAEPLDGYFSGVDGTGTSFLTCLSAEACAEGGGCSEGYTGASCSQCEEGLYLNDTFECTQCPALIVTILLLLAGAIIFILVLVFKMNDVKSGGFTKNDVFIKVIISAFQVNGLALFYAFEWNEYMTNYLWFQNQLTSLGTSFFNLQCMGDTTESSFVGDSMIWLFFPILLSLFIFIGVFVHGLHEKGQLGAGRDIPVVKRVLKRTIDTVKGTAGFAIFFIQPNLVRQAALVFSCVRMGANPSEVYLSEDLSIQCWQSGHWLYIAFLGFPMLLLYVIGLPYALHSTLSNKKNREKVRQIIADQEYSLKKVNVEKKSRDEDDDDIYNSGAFYSNYAFLFLGYRNEKYNWEVVMLLRKSLIALVGVAFAYDSRTQGLFGLMIMLNFVIIHAYQRPFVRSWLNAFEFAGLVASVLTFFFGLLTLDSGMHGDAVGSASALALTVNIIYLVIVIPFFFYKITYGESVLKKFSNKADTKDNEIEMDEKTTEQEEEVTLDPAEDPAEWVVKTDPKSGRTFYANKKAKLKGWKKPACLEAAEAAAV